MNHYEFNGEKYKQASRYQKEWGNQLIDGLTLTGRETILDLGCGDGVLTEQIAALVPEGKVIGLDASAGMIETAKKLQRANLTFIQENINDLHHQNEFNVIYSNAALHWVKDHKKLLHACFCALKSNGILSWNFGGKGTCEHFHDAISMLINSDAFSVFFQEFEWPWFMPSKEEYEELTADIGFRNVAIEFQDADRYFSDTVEMTKWIDQPCIVPFLVCIPEEKKKDFRSQLIDRMIERTLQPDGRCFETFKRIHIYAVK